MNILGAWCLNDAKTGRSEGKVLSLCMYKWLVLTWGCFKLNYSCFHYLFSCLFPLTQSSEYVKFLRMPVTTNSAAPLRSLLTCFWSTHAFGLNQQFPLLFNPANFPMAHLLANHVRLKWSPYTSIPKSIVMNSISRVFIKGIFHHGMFTACNKAQTENSWHRTRSGY